MDSRCAPHPSTPSPLFLPFPGWGEGEPEKKTSELGTHPVTHSEDTRVHVDVDSSDQNERSKENPQSREWRRCVGGLTSQSKELHGLGRDHDKHCHHDDGSRDCPFGSSAHNLGCALCTGGHWALEEVAELARLRPNV